MDLAKSDGGHRGHRHIQRVPDAPSLDDHVSDGPTGHHDRQQHERGSEASLHDSTRRYSLTRASGFPVESRSEMTATAAAPARITAGARSRVIPPIATIGFVEPPRSRIRAASLTNVVPTSRYPVSFVEVPKIGPTAI